MKIVRLGAGHMQCQWRGNAELGIVTLPLRADREIRPEIKSWLATHTLKHVIFGRYVIFWQTSDAVLFRLAWG